MHGMRRAILAAGLFLLTAACGASGGGPGTVGPAGQGQPAMVHVDPIAVPAQGQPAPAPSQAPAVTTTHPAAQPAGSAPASSPGTGSGPAVDDGSIRPCPMGNNPPLHKLCPV